MAKTPRTRGEKGGKSGRPQGPPGHDPGKEVREGTVSDPRTAQSSKPITGSDTQNLKWWLDFLLKIIANHDKIEGFTTDLYEACTFVFLWICAIVIRFRKSDDDASADEEEKD